MAKNANKVTIVAGALIYVGSEHVGNISGRGEVTVTFLQAGVSKFAARFKYRSAKASAVHWVKFILTKMTTAEYLAKYDDSRGPAPLAIAEEFGYVCYNVLQMRKKQAEVAARNARFMNVTVINHLPA